MTDIKEKILINLNSENAILLNDTFKSNVIFNFPNVLEYKNDIEFVEGGVYNCSIPVSFYNINYTNNILYYSLNSAIYNITCSVGNYNFNTFSTELTNKFLLNGHSISISINKITGIITFTNSTGTLNFFQELNSTLWGVLGFKIGSGNYPATLNIITPPYLLNLLGIKKIKIYSENLGIRSLDSKNLEITSLIDTISVFEPSYNLLTHMNSDGTYSRINKKFINQIDIQLKDENSQYINFNNIDWTITLCLIIYRKIGIDSKTDDLLLDELNKIDDTLQNLNDILSNQQINQTDNQQIDQIIDQPLDNNNNLNTDDLDILSYEN